MGKTNIRVDFRITGNDFNPTDFTNMLSLKPTKTWQKGEKIRESNKDYVYTCWQLSTEYEESLDINNQLKKIFELIVEKESILVELKNINVIEFMFEIVINIENNETPAIYLESEMIKFAHNIGAEFDFDLYIF